jgi:FkbM family methyltransferase
LRIVSRAIRDWVNKLLWRVPPRLFVFALSIKHRIKGTDIQKVLLDYPTGPYYVIYGPSQKKLFVAHRERLRLLGAGVGKRVEQLSSRYKLTIDLLRNDDVIIDCGANVGELSLWPSEGSTRYYGFEPDPQAFGALARNVGNTRAFNTALSDFDGVAHFFLKTASADSSLIQPMRDGLKTVEVECVTLDRFVQEKGISVVRLLKVEAEGAEPEVLRGAVRTLEKTDFVAIDAGPERRGQNTIVECLNLLFASSFTLVAANENDNCYLLRRSGLNE